MRGQKNVIAAIAREGLRPRVKVVVGGAPATRRWAEEIGADGYAKDAAAAVTLMQSLMRSKDSQLARTTTTTPPSRTEP
jgi:methanogenic corrinoid protein MtbC1